MQGFLSVVQGFANSHGAYSLHACSDANTTTANCQLTAAFLWKVLTGDAPKVCPGCLPECITPKPPTPTPTPAPTPPSPPQPDACATCNTGVCAPCKACITSKTGSCAACWKVDPKLGTACLYDDGHGCQKCWNKPPSPGPGPAPVPGDGHPPALPAAWSTLLTLNGGPVRVYSNAATKQVATYAATATGGTSFTILDCKNQIKYSNFQYWPTPNASCVTSKPIAYQDCPTAPYYPPGQPAPWPPAADDFYGGVRAKASFSGHSQCPVPGNVRMCDLYSYKDEWGYMSATFAIDTVTQVPLQAKITEWGQTKTIQIQTLTPGAPDPSEFAKPSGCPSAPPSPSPPKPSDECKADMAKLGCDVKTSQKNATTATRRTRTSSRHWGAPTLSAKTSARSFQRHRLRSSYRRSCVMSLFLSGRAYAEASLQEYAMARDTFFLIPTKQLGFICNALRFFREF